MARRKAKPAPDWAFNALDVAKCAESVEIEDVRGSRVTVTVAHWRRWPSVREKFRPVADQQVTEVAAVETPTGDNEMEN